ncbi:uncharacterized protein TRIREDRAFT_124259 [Trichoderma reesei QM6a]|uniref:Predicted protein n=2 Tax=Hypocrea jecorina TaxID=51453 RepID=G0RXA3_HYPJQ
MAQSIQYLLLLLGAFATLIQASPQAKPPLPYCDMKQIHTMNVANCRCRPHYKGCFTAARTCHMDIPNRHTNSYYPGCTDNDKLCLGCGLWFHTLCDCVKGPSGCTHQGTVQPNGDQVWFLTPVGEKLVTTTDILPGILEMADNPAKYGESWNFAQKYYDPGSEALALNSVRARTHEQFHIHVCKKPDVKKDAKVLKILDTAKHNTGPTLEQVGNNDLWCRTVTKGNGPVRHFAEAIQAFLATGQLCKGLAGAAIIRDAHENLWACVTGDQHGPLAQFCAGK